MAEVVNRNKASSHPTKPGGIYVGVVKSSTPDGRVYVYIPRLANTLGPMRVLNSTVDTIPTVGTQVLCAHIDMSTAEMYVLGYVNPIADSNEPVDLRDLRVELLMDVN